LEDRATSVLVLCEDSPDGHAALRHAQALARDRRTHLTVLATAPTEPLEKSCMRCRSGTARWNQAICEVASEELDEARSLLKASANVEYRIEHCRPREAVARAAASCGAATLVVAGRSGLRVRRAAHQFAARRLRPDGCELVVAPPAAQQSGHPGLNPRPVSP
jgi:hypothetical protein